jgi:hypothetical protein
MKAHSNTEEETWLPKRVKRVVAGKNAAKRCIPESTIGQ